MYKPTRSDYLTGALSLLLAGLLVWQTPTMSLLDRTLYDQSMRLATEMPSPRVAVIANDANSDGQPGQGAWSRESDARLMERLASAGAKVIAYTAPMTIPQSESGLSHIERIQRLYTASSRSFAEAGLNRLPAEYEQMEAALRQARLALDADTRLAASFSKAGNVWLPLVPVPNAAQAVNAQLPQLLKAAAGQAVWLQTVDSADSVLRQQSLLNQNGGPLQPSLALTLAARSLDLPLAEMHFDPVQRRLQLGALKFATDDAGRMWGRFYAGQSGKPAVAIDSSRDILSGKVSAEKYRDRIVLIGPVSAGQGLAVKTPLAIDMSPLMVLAHNVSSILQQDGYNRPQWADWTGLGAGLLVCLYLLLALPRLSSVAGLLSSSLLFGLLLLAELLLLLSLRVWLPLGGAASVLLLGQVMLLLARGLMAEAGVVAIVPIISPYEADRARIAAAHEAAGLGFHEVFVDTPIEECVRRDPKGLYKKARRGEIKNFTGVDDPYEPPLNPEITLDTATMDPDACVEAILEKLEALGYPCLGLRALPTDEARATRETAPAAVQARANDIERIPASAAGPTRPSRS